MKNWYVSQKTGECVYGIKEMIKVIIENIFHFHFLDLTWKKEE